MTQIFNQEENSRLIKKSRFSKYGRPRSKSATIPVRNINRKIKGTHINTSEQINFRCDMNCSTRERSPFQIYSKPKFEKPPTRNNFLRVVSIGLNLQTSDDQNIIQRSAFKSVCQVGDFFKNVDITFLYDEPINPEDISRSHITSEFNKIGETFLVLDQLAIYKHGKEIFNQILRVSPKFVFPLIIEQQNKFRKLHSCASVK